jgi:hypothetical protein
MKRVAWLQTLVGILAALPAALLGPFSSHALFVHAHDVRGAHTHAVHFGIDGAPIDPHGHSEGDHSDGDGSLWPGGDEAAGIVIVLNGQLAAPSHRAVRLSNSIPTTVPGLAGPLLFTAPPGVRVHESSRHARAAPFRAESALTRILQAGHALLI